MNITYRGVSAGTKEIPGGYRLRLRDQTFHFAMSSFDAITQREFLRGLAAKNYPSTPLVNFIILIDYTVVPPTYSLQHIDEFCDNYMKTSNSAASDLRTVRSLEDFRNHRGNLLIESRISNGIAIQFVMTQLRRSFWD